MLEYQHILLATSLADHAQKVAQTAIEFSKKSNAKLSLVHVIDHTPIIFGSGEYAIPVDISIEEELTKAATEALMAFVNQLKLTNVDQYVLHGAPKTEVTTLAKKINADLIVVGSHAQHGTELLLGSTSNAILHVAHCDVYAVNTR